MTRNRALELGDYNRGILLHRNALAVDGASCASVMEHKNGTTHAPEEYKHTPQTIEVDVWSHGLMIYNPLMETRCGMARRRTRRRRRRSEGSGLGPATPSGAARCGRPGDAGGARHMLGMTRDGVRPRARSRRSCGRKGRSCVTARLRVLGCAVNQIQKKVMNHLSAFSSLLTK